MVEPFRSTIVLSEADLADIALNEADASITLSASAPAADALRKGSVFVAGKSPRTPKGLLRIVKSVERDDDTVRLQTLHAPIQLAFRRVHIETARRSSGELGAAAWSGNLEPLAFDPFHRHVGASQRLNVIIFDGDNDPDSTNDQVAVDGELAGNVDFTFALDFDWGALEELPQAVEDCLSGLLEGKFDCSLTSLLPEAKAVLDVTPSLASSIDLHGAAVIDFDKEVKLFEANLGELVYGPIVITPNARILAHVQGEASAQFATSVDAAVYFDTSVTVSSKHPSSPSYQPPKLRDVSFDARPPELTLKAEARAALGVELNLLLYGVTGPSAKAEAFGAVSADVFRKPCVELHAGLQGSLGVKVTTPAFLFLNPFDILDWHADFEAIDEKLDVPVPPCEAPPDASTLPPGAGPDGAHLASPTFEPWSRTVSSLLDSGGTVPGGTTYWLDQRRAIDGRLVIAAKAAEALVKLDERGSLIWARRFEDEDAGGSALHPVRTIATHDAALLVLAEAGIPPLQLVKLTQAGNVLWSRSLDVPDAIECGIQPVGLARDAGSGFFVVASCALTQKVLVVHLNQAGELLDAHGFVDPAALGLVTTLATRAGDDLFVAGRVTQPEGDSMFGFRQDAKGELLFAQRYVACDAGPDVFPVRAIVEANGDVTVAGRGGAEHNGFIARLRRDGGVGFAAFPGFGFGLGSVFVLDSIAALPTTGYIVSGSSVRFTSSAPNDTSGIALLQLDAVGKPVWTRRYTLRDASGEYLASAQSDVTLTDDGGALLSGFARQSATAIPADLWSLKVFARDGAVTFARGAAVASEPDDPDNAVQALDCSLTTAPWPPTLTPEPDVSTTPSRVTAAAWSTSVASQSE